jgi:hypothetical protein
MFYLISLSLLEIERSQFCCYCYFYCCECCECCDSLDATVTILLKEHLPTKESSSHSHEHVRDCIGIIDWIVLLIV